MRSGESRDGGQRGSGRHAEEPSPAAVSQEAPSEEGAARLVGGAPGSAAGELAAPESQDEADPAPTSSGLRRSNAPSEPSWSTRLSRGEINLPALAAPSDLGRLDLDLSPPEPANDSEEPPPEAGRDTDRSVDLTVGEAARDSRPATSAATESSPASSEPASGPEELSGDAGVRGGSEAGVPGAPPKDLHWRDVLDATGTFDGW